MDMGRLQLAVSELWQAALDHTQWSDALGKVGDAAGAAGACILSPNPAHGCLVNSGLQEAFDIYFKDGWHALDDRRRGIDRLMRGEVLIDHDILSTVELSRSAYYNDFLPRMGIRWWMGAGFNSGDNFYCLTLQQSLRREPFSEEDRVAVASIRPALNQLGRLLDVTDQTAMGTTLSALEKLSQAALCIGSRGEVLRSNALAEALFDSGFELRRDRLAIADERARREFDRALTITLASWTSASPVTVRRAGRPPLVLRLVRLANPARHTFFGARVLVTIKEIAPFASGDLDVILKTYGLTPAEATLASKLAAGTSLEEAAEILSISKETARNQLKAVFAKTQTHRQGELVALLAAAS